MTPEIAIPSVHLRNYLLLFETYYGELLGWCIRTGIPVESIPTHIEVATEEWWKTMEGIKSEQEEMTDEGNFDYAHALMNVPHMILAKYHIHLWTPIEKIIKLDPGRDLIPKRIEILK